MRSTDGTPRGFVAPEQRAVLVVPGAVMTLTVFHFARPAPRAAVDAFARPSLRQRLFRWLLGVDPR